MDLSSNLGTDNYLLGDLQLFNWCISLSNNKVAKYCREGEKNSVCKTPSTMLVNIQ